MITSRGLLEKINTKELMLKDRLNANYTTNAYISLSKEDD